MRLFCSTLIGRGKESAVLASAVEAVSRGQGGGVFIVGEAGIGKTRLAAEAEDLAERRGLRTLRGRATASSPQFRPLTEALFSVLRHIDPGAQPELDPFRPALSRLVPEWRLERPAGADDSVVVLAEAILRLLARLAQDEGCLVVLEDLHDADDDTLAVVEYLTDNLAHTPVLLVATVRTEPGTALDMVQSAARRRAATVLEPSRLDDVAVRQFMAGCLQTPPECVPEVTLARMLSDADGIPFHVEELLAGMVGSGSLVRDGDGWRAGAAREGDVPATVRASVGARAPNA